MLLRANPVVAPVAFIAMFVSLLVCTFWVRLGSQLVTRGTGLQGAVAVSIVVDTPPSQG